MPASETAVIARSIGEFGLAAAIVPSGSAISSSTITPPRTSDAVTPADCQSSPRTG